MKHFQSNGNTSDVIETGKMTPPMSNGKPENGLTSTDSGKLNGNDGSSDHPASPLVRSNGDLNVDSTSLCHDANDDVVTPTTSMQECHLEQQQQPTTTIHGVQVRSPIRRTDALLHRGILYPFNFLQFPHTWHLWLINPSRDRFDSYNYCYWSGFRQLAIHFWCWISCFVCSMQSRSVFRRLRLAFS